jgi:protein-S-isoprenylcysteine O-methyltransferase Ste14
MTVMVMIARHLLAILILPFMAAVVVPYWLLSSLADTDTRWIGDWPFEWIARSLGALVLVGGLALFSWCVISFARVGRGTLAPWDPTQNLVAVGPYRFSRNPMITGVALVLAGEALIFGSFALGFWAAVFVVVNQVYFIAWEEPDLASRFGASYLDYKAKVPRWLPLWKPRA